MYRFITFLLLLSLAAHSQDTKKSPAYERLYHYAEKLYASTNATATTDSIAIATYLQVIGLLKKENQHPQVLADCYLKCGILQMLENKHAAALGFFRESINTIASAGNLPDSFLFKPYLYSGSIHYTRNELDSAIYDYKKAETINNRYGSLNESERLFNKFGALYYETGDYKKSIAYFEKALAVATERKPANIFFIVNYKNNIAAALIKLEQYNQALELFKSLLPYHVAEDELYYNIGKTYAEAGNAKEALTFLRRAHRIKQRRYNILAKVFISLGQYDSAGFYLQQARQSIPTGNNRNKETDYGITLKYSGDLASATGNPLTAINNYQLAIIQLDPAFNDTSISRNPSSFTGLQNFSLLFDALVAKAVALNHLSTTAAREQSLSAFQSALMLASHIEHTYFSDDARVFLKSKVNPAAKQAVDIAIGLFNLTANRKYLDLAFDFVESNKASVLQAGLQNLELSAIPGLPEQLVKEEKTYKTLIARLAIQSGSETDSAAVNMLRKKTRDAEIALSEVQQKLDENTRYHQIKFNSGHISLDSLQQSIVQNDAAILSYYYTTTQLLCFYITREEAGFSTLPLHNTVFTTITSLRKELQVPEASGRKSLQDAGAALFSELILPVYGKIKNKKRLTIIPYNETGYIPFEMLTDLRDHSLLLSKFAVSYNYSAHFLSPLKKETGNGYEVLAMAPFSDPGNTAPILPALPSSRDEISELPGKRLFGPEATKMQFISLAGNYPVIHLATHAFANDINQQGSYIEFYGTANDPDTSHRLYEQEIYNLNMQSARLIVLSACETGDGLLVNGEGVMSLSRSFSYAGCQSVITSLWQADDIATAFITRRLHGYLQQGMAADKALQKAKLDYLNSKSIDDRFKNPAYWAHLVLIGNPGSVTAHPFSIYPYLLLLAATVVIFIIIRKKINRA